MTGSTEVIQERRRLAEVEDDWRRLAERCGNAFLSPEWFGAWLSGYGSDAEPAVTVTRHEDGSLMGLMPLAMSGPRGWRTIRFAGANLGDRFHPLAAPGHEVEVAAEGFAALSASKRAATVVLDRAPADGAWVRELRAAGFRPAPAARGDVLPYIDLDGLTWEEYLAGRSRNFRGQVRRKARALADAHELRFRTTAEPARLDSDIEAFFGLHDARWAERGGSSSSTARSRAFHRDFAGRALERGWLRLWFLEADGEAVAAWYGWRLGERYSYYLAGFSPRWSDRSVGFVLLAHTVRSAIEEGAREYDLLLGDEDYKARFASGERSVETVAAVRAGHPALAVARLESALRRAGRRLPPRPRRRAQVALGRLTARLPTGNRR